MRVLFIASLSHSGSTVLNLTLGTHPRLIGLGEVFWLAEFNRFQLEDELNARCTCGRIVRECEFWASVIQQILNNLGESREKKYKIITKQFRQHFGEDAILVDSSKFIPHLHTWQNIPGIDLQVLYVLKDVRGYTISQIDALNGELRDHRLRSFTGNKNLDIFLYRNTVKRPLYLFWKWYRDNRTMHRRLQQSNIPYLQISYENFALQPAISLARIGEFIGVDIPTKSLAPGQTHSHAFLGNPMLNTESQKERIEYDNRWFSRNDWLLASLLSPHIMRWNHKQVYSKK